MMVSACGNRPAPWIEPSWLSERLKVTRHSVSRNARTTNPNDMATIAMMHATKRRVGFCEGAEEFMGI